MYPGSLLYNLVPIFITLLLYKSVLYYSLKFLTWHAHLLHIQIQYLFVFMCTLFNDAVTLWLYSVKL